MIEFIKSIFLYVPSICQVHLILKSCAQSAYSLQAGRIHISEPCQRCLEDSEFVTVFRGSMHVKVQILLC